MRTVLVTGIRGKTGRQLAAALTRQPDIEVRGAGRSPVDLPGVRAIRFDWDEPAGWPEVLKGVSAIYLVKPNTRDPASTVASFLHSAREAERVVLLSEIACESRDESTDERKVEKIIEATPFDWTILRPNWFMQNFAEPGFYLEDVRDHGVLNVPTGGQPVSFVDTRDVAEVAAAALIGESHAGRAYTLTGPQALTFAEVGKKIGEVAGHPVRHTDQPLTAYLSEELAGGAPRFLIEYYRRIYTSIQNGQTAALSAAVEQVTGHPPRNFSAFVGENKDVWRRILAS
ncbi:NAD(P)H-binding protein [Mesorhizobium sp. BAC0120]|uniref:NAD(P)H-binding protein n=1 Tax=Mesorhizobium sp. BAC0120 TaxID=3090670 RepID=UPI00298C85ED|nr:NAD(P)H-binding protein [Mesorhizobium sp. BAC0120]MDW6020392.1 NAD(P)H-binding protein [Mesorhizobium sp. BAC0120]